MAEQAPFTIYTVGRPIVCLYARSMVLQTRSVLVHTVGLLYAMQLKALQLCPLRIVGSTQYSQENKYKRAPIQPYWRTMAKKQRRMANGVQCRDSPLDGGTAATLEENCMTAPKLPLTAKACMYVVSAPSWYKDLKVRELSIADTR